MKERFRSQSCARAVGPQFCPERCTCAVTSLKRPSLKGVTHLANQILGHGLAASE